MRFLASPRWRLFLIIWVLYSLHFATNVVREHYPAFSIAQHGTFRVDEYQGFHSDIFRHTDGHSYIDNQVFVSVLAAVPLFLCRPVLDAIEGYSRARLVSGDTGGVYRTDKPLRVRFFRLVKERGLDLRFGAATVITSAFFMAPITAAFLVYFYGVLRGRGLSSDGATELTLLLGFCTPIFFRTSTLNHNMFVMYGLFIAFCLLWERDPDGAVPLRSRVLAGFFGGVTLAADYIGVIVLPLLYAYLVLPRLRTATAVTTVVESLPMVLGSLPPVAFLLYSQWAMFGNPVLPAQYWMPAGNVYATVGTKGMTLPDLGIFLDSLFGSSYGMYSWGPILLVALWPTRGLPEATLLLPRIERRWIVATWVVFLLFTSSNQYSRMQFNSGFRYLIPLVPLLVLAMADRWFALPAAVRFAFGAASLVHSWVLTVFREPVLLSWRLFVREGIQLPWYRVLSLTSSSESRLLGNWWVPSLLLAITGGLLALVWRYGARLEERTREQIP